MAWKKVPAELVEFLTIAVRPFEADRRMMFGCPVYFINNNMFVGAHEDNIMIRLSPEDQDELYAEHSEAVPFAPMGRRMKEYALLPAALYNAEPVFEKWLQRSYAYVSTLPPKEAKGKGTKRRSSRARS